MADWIKSLVSKTPFSPLQQHMQEVLAAAEFLPQLHEALVSTNQDEILEVQGRINEHEKRADAIEKEIHHHLQSIMFLPINRQDLHHMLNLQDDVADGIKALAMESGLHTLQWTDELRETQLQLILKTHESVLLAGEIAIFMDDLVESAFASHAIEIVENKIADLTEIVNEAETIGQTLLALIYQTGANWSPPDFYHWMRVRKRTVRVVLKARALALSVRTSISR